MLTEQNKNKRKQKQLRNMFSNDFHDCLNSGNISYNACDHRIFKDSCLVLELAFYSVSRDDVYLCNNLSYNLLMFFQ